MNREAKAWMAAVNKHLGDKGEADDLVILGSQIRHLELPRIPTGAFALDHALGGGWPANQWSEVTGEESAGKTTLVLKTIAHNQALDPNWQVGWIAAEEFVVPFAEMLGVDMDRVAVVDTNLMGVAYSAAEMFLQSRAFDCVVIDSLPALVPEVEDDKSMAEMGVADAARLTNKFTRKARKATRRSLTAEDRFVTGFMINQWREKVGVMYGDNRTTPGGLGKNYFYFCRVDVRRDEWIKSGKDVVGQTIKYIVRKNKTAPSGRSATIDFYVTDFEGHPAGSFDEAKQIINVGITSGHLVQRGAFYRFGEEKYRGRPGLQEAIAEDPKLVERIREAIYAGPPVTEEPPADKDPE